MSEKIKVNDLRSAIKLLKSIPGEIIETDVEVNPHGELSGVYRYIGAGGTVARPTKEGPAMIFKNVKGHPDAEVLIGLLASRKRVGYLLDCPPEELGKKIYHSVENPIPPVVTEKPAPCQEIIHRASDEDFDLYKLIPAPTNTLHDAGPYITLGMCYATHPDTGKSDVTIHRLCIQGKDELSIFFTPGARHIGAMAERAEELNEKLPISISIGVDPAIEIGSCFEPPTTPLGYDELAVAGALRGEPVELCRCLTVNERAIANAEYVIEGEVIPHVRVQEDKNSGTGFAMPEFPGYTGPASSDCWLIKVKAVTHRKNPIMQTCIGPSEEHVSMVGIQTLERIEYKIKLSFAEYIIFVMKIGKDFNIVFSGGEREHIGCTVLSLPRPSLSDEKKLSATSSVINIIGHKDEYICRYIGESFAKKYNSVVVCSGGFHIDNISKKQIEELKNSVRELIEKI